MEIYKKFTKIIACILNIELVRSKLDIQTFSIICKERKWKVYYMYGSSEYIKFVINRYHY